MSDQIIVVVQLVLDVVGGELLNGELDDVVNDGKVVEVADENLAIEMEPAVAVDEMVSLGRD